MAQKQETFEKVAEAAALNDEELDEVNGGGEGTLEGRSIPDSNHRCRNFVCKKCKKKLLPSIFVLNPAMPVFCPQCAWPAKCARCQFAYYKEGGSNEGWYCTFEE